MFATEPAGAFREFGESLYYSTRRPLTFWSLPRAVKERRKLVRTCAPASPGVYGMIDAEGQLIYVGKSKCLANRLMSYFPSQPGGEKSERVGRRAKRLVWETAPHEFLASLRELELIRRFAPRFNVQGRPEHQRPAYIYLTAGIAPFFCVGGVVPRGCPAWFGPFQGVGRYRAAVEQLNRRFLLRDCPAKTPMSFAEQRELFASDRKAACLRYELETCLGPCAALCTAREYGHSVQRALAFLRGEDRSCLDRLEQAMREAANHRQFERAAALRDSWRLLLQIERSAERLRDLRNNYTFVYELRCRSSQRMWVFLRAGQALGAQPKPSSWRTARRALARLEAIDAASDASIAYDDLDMLRLTGRWFFERKDEMKSTWPYAAAASYCRGFVSRPPATQSAKRSQQARAGVA